MILVPYLQVRLDDTISRPTQSIFTYSAVKTPSESSVVKDYALALNFMISRDDMIMVQHFADPLQVFRSSCGGSFANGNYSEYEYNTYEYEQSGAVPASDDAPTCTAKAFESWTHVAVAFNTTEGNLKLYLNGTKVMDVLRDEETLGPGHILHTLKLPPPHEGGILTFGQHPATYQIRVWGVERTAEEIYTWMRHTEVPGSETIFLVADFRMDSTGEEEGIFKPDMSGNGNHLAVGAIHEARKWIIFLRFYISNDGSLATHDWMGVMTD
eukprot:scaffold477398_cov15-Prasinocladus_malaysianus.AAC.1